MLAGYQELRKAPWEGQADALVPQEAPGVGQCPQVQVRSVLRVTLLIIGYEQFQVVYFLKEK